MGIKKANTRSRAAQVKLGSTRPTTKVPPIQTARPARKRPARNHYVALQIRYNLEVVDGELKRIDQRLAWLHTDQSELRSSIENVTQKIYDAQSNQGPNSHDLDPNSFEAIEAFIQRRAALERLVVRTVSNIEIEKVLRVDANETRHRLLQELGDDSPTSESSPDSPTKGPALTQAATIDAVQQKIIVETERREAIREEWRQYVIKYRPLGACDADGMIRGIPAGLPLEIYSEANLQHVQILYREGKAERRLEKLRADLGNEEQKIDDQVSFEESVDIHIDETPEDDSLEHEESLRQLIKCRLASIEHRISALDVTSLTLRREQAALEQKNGSIDFLDGQKLRADTVYQHNKKILDDEYQVEMRKAGQGRLLAIQRRLGEIEIKRRATQVELDRYRTHLIETKAVYASIHPGIKMQKVRLFALRELLQARLGSVTSAADLARSKRIKEQYGQRDKLIQTVLDTDAARENWEKEFSRIYNELGWAGLHYTGYWKYCETYYSKWGQKDWLQDYGDCLTDNDKLEIIVQGFEEELVDAMGVLRIANRCAILYRRENRDEGMNELATPLPHRPKWHTPLTEEFKKNMIAFFTSPDIRRELIKREQLSLFSSRPERLYTWMNKMVAQPFDERLTRAFLEWAERSHILFRRNHNTDWVMVSEGFETVPENPIGGPTRTFEAVVPTSMEFRETFREVKGYIFALAGDDKLNSPSRLVRELDIFGKVHGKGYSIPHGIFHDVIKHMCKNCDLFIYHDKPARVLLRINNGWPRNALLKYQPLVERPRSYDVFRRTLISAYTSGHEGKGYGWSPGASKKPEREEDLLLLCNEWLGMLGDVPVPAHMFRIYLRTCHEKRDLFQMVGDAWMFVEKWGWPKNTATRPLRIPASGHK